MKDSRENQRAAEEREYGVPPSQDSLFPVEEENCAESSNLDPVGVGRGVLRHGESLRLETREFLEALWALAEPGMRWEMRILGPRVFPTRTFLDLPITDAHWSANVVWADALNGAGRAIYHGVHARIAGATDGRARSIAGYTALVLDFDVRAEANEAIRKARSRRRSAERDHRQWPSDVGTDLAIR